MQDIPDSNNDDVCFEFAPVVEAYSGLRKAFNLASRLHLDLAVDDLLARSTVYVS